MAPPRSGARRRLRQPERQEQSGVITALLPFAERRPDPPAGTNWTKPIQALAIYTLGSTRASRCGHCGEYSTDMSTRQTPGLSDVLAFLRPPAAGQPSVGLWVEVKAERNRPSREQREFAAFCALAGWAHVTGGVTEVVRFLVIGGWVPAENVPHYRRPVGGLW